MQEMRFELDRVRQVSTTVDPDSLPLLDAFIQESMRISPSDASKALHSDQSPEY